MEGERMTKQKEQVAWATGKRGLGYSLQEASKHTRAIKKYQDKVDKMMDAMNAAFEAADDIVKTYKLKKDLVRKAENAGNKTIEYFERITEDAETEIYKQDAAYGED